jgi:DNA-binding beta-propeller fold protein YncE
MLSRISFARLSAASFSLLAVFWFAAVPSVSRAQNMYVSNSSNATISVFNATGNLVQTISSNLNGPQELAFDVGGNLYVANVRNSTISKFDSAGVFQNNFGDSNLNQAYGLAFDSAGNLYAANASDNTISKFDSAGVFLSTIGNGSNLSAPTFIAFSAPTAVTDTPEPGSLALLFGIGLSGSLCLRRRLRTKV